MLPDTRKISEITGAKQTQCSCNACKHMCHKQSCIGTPNDILTLANNGFSEHLISTVWAAGLIIGMPLIDMVQIGYDEQKKQCPLLTEGGLCRLHALDIKPTEGVLSDMHGTNKNAGPRMLIMVANSWLLDRNKKSIALLNKLIK